MLKVAMALLGAALLGQAAAGVQDEESSAPESYAFVIDSPLFAVQFEDESVRLVMPDGSEAVLPRVPSGSGARFSDGQVTFWIQGDEAMLEVGGLAFQGRLEPSGADDPYRSPDGQVTGASGVACSQQTASPHE